jgi:carbon storage regulator CsrA
MPVPSRRIGAEIVIDGQIRVVVAAVQGDQVCLGIGTPATVRWIHKERMNAGCFYLAPNGQVSTKSIFSQ